LTIQQLCCINKYYRQHQQIRPAETQSQVFIKFPVKVGVGGQKDFADVECKSSQKNDNKDSLRILPEPSQILCETVSHKIILAHKMN
jgi:hypothetical protein